MKPAFVDVHCHLEYPAYDADREAVLERMEISDVAAISVGISNDRLESTVALARTHTNIFASLGFHPHDAGEREVPDFDLLEKLAAAREVVAIGECGLDYSRNPDEAEKKKQRELFKRQIDLANRLGKPLMLHIRDAYSDALDILRTDARVTGNAHFFAGTWQEAQQFLDRGFSLSFGGVVTFARQYDEIIAEIPLERLLSETDAPFVSPVPHRGKRNEPVYVREVVAKLAEIRNEDGETVRSATVENAQRVFSLGF
jgi:TatD DNase family protein